MTGRPRAASPEAPAAPPRALQFRLRRNGFPVEQLEAVRRWIDNYHQLKERRVTVKDSHSHSVERIHPATLPGWPTDRRDRPGAGQ